MTRHDFGTGHLLVGDCVQQMRTLPEASVDAVVTDPPYGLAFMGKAWDGFGTPLGFQTWTEQWAREAFRVLKPGGHILAFGGTRMYHRLAAGIEDAGFEVRDTLMWLYGSGFPKSLDVSKAIDKAAGADREVVGSKITGKARTDEGWQGGQQQVDITAPSTEAAKKWQGWGTALKPAVEPIVLARKPLIGTVAENVLRHGTGALNVDASRIGANGEIYSPPAGGTPNQQNQVFGKGLGVGSGQHASGRWPANVLLDEVAAALLDARADELGASRFFYVAKAGTAERNKGLNSLPKREVFGDRDPALDGISSSTARANIHPTVKPVDLMAYLIRLIARKDSVILDPFLGSGTTAIAAIQEGVRWIGCEREPDYVKIIQGRISAAQPGLGLNLEQSA
jgi:site-specific DNA-methyltransferase (adenine-specific)